MISPLLQCRYSDTCAQAMAWTEDFLVFVTTGEESQSQATAHVELSPSVDIEWGKGRIEEEMTSLFAESVEASEVFGRDAKVDVIAFTTDISKLRLALLAAEQAARQAR